MGYTHSFTCGGCGYDVELYGLGRDTGVYVELESCVCHQCHEVVDVVRRRWGEDAIQEPTAEELERRFERATYPDAGYPHKFKRWLRRKLGLKSEFADEIASELAEYEEYRNLEVEPYDPKSDYWFGNQLGGQLVEKFADSLQRYPKRRMQPVPLDHCPKCVSTDITPWGKPYTCPKCGDPMKQGQGVVALWD